MRLRDLIEAAGVEPASLSVPQAAAADPDPEVTALAHSADACGPGSLFFCVRGFRADGHDFAPAAVAAGAVALVCERPLDLGVPSLVVDSTRAAMAPLAAAFHGDPTAELRLVGVTGTNGKTTTAFLVRQVLEAEGIRTGLLGTVFSIVGGAREEVERTTPEAVELQATFRRMLDAGDRACAMEVSSHALDLHRADAIRFDCAVFTNLTQDHLDYHGTLEEYFGAKRRLFSHDQGPHAAAAAINLDDRWGPLLAEEVAEAAHAHLVTYAIEVDADYRASDVRSGARGSSFQCRGPDGEAPVEMALPGLFNVYNALGAIAAAGTLGIPLERAAKALASAPQVPGRFERVDEGQDFTVLVDYAHTPDSLENVLAAARGLLAEAGGEGRLVCVFGAGGDRDRDKRPLMGEVARRLSDLVVVTSDNPRSEDPGAIIAAIVAGAAEAASGGAAEAESQAAAQGGKGPAGLETEPDRRAAITRAIGAAQGGDVVVIAGKGHEQGQEFEGGRKVPFDDREVAREALRGLRSRPAA